MMKLLVTYFVIAGTASIAFSLLLTKLTGPKGFRPPFVIAAAVVLALVWPLTAPMLAFASVAAAELVRAALQKKVAPAAVSAAAVSPAAAKF